MNGEGKELRLDEEEKREPKAKKKRPERKEPELVFEDGTAVAIPSGPEAGIYLIQDGKRRWVPNTWTQTKLGIRMDYVVVVFPEQGESIPLGAPMPDQAPEEPLF